MNFSFNFIFFTCTILICEYQPVISQTCNRARLPGPTQMATNWWEHIYAFLSPFCYADGDQSNRKSFDEEESEYKDMLKDWINDNPNDNSRLSFFSFFGFDVLGTPNIKNNISFWPHWCNVRFEQTRRNVTLGPELQDIFNNSPLANPPPSTGIYNLSTVLSKLPIVDTTTFGRDLFCRDVLKDKYTKCPIKSLCQGLTNVPFMPTAVVDTALKVCSILISDEELKADLKDKWEFDELIDTCKDKNLNIEMRCMPYNKTSRAKLKKHVQTYLKYEDIFERHKNRYLEGVQGQLVQLVKELENIYNFKMLAEGQNCNHSLNYTDVGLRLFNYIISPPDGSVPFNFLANFETASQGKIDEQTFVVILRRSCDFTQNLECNNNCICVPSPNTKKKGLNESATLYQLSERIALIGFFILMVIFRFNSYLY